MKSSKIMIFSQSDISRVQGTTEPYYIIKELSENYDVYLFAPEDPDLENVLYFSLPRINFIPSFFWNNIFLFPFFFYHLLIISPNILYTYDGFNLIAYILVRISGTTWVIDLQMPPTRQAKEFNTLKNRKNIVKTFYYFIQDLVYKRTFQAANSIITVSEGIKKELSSEYGVSNDKINVIPLGVDTERFNPDRFEVKKGLNQIELIYLGSVTSFRGIDTVIEAISLLDPLNESVHLHIAGDGPDQDIRDLKRLASDLGVSENITWHGYIDHDTVPTLLSCMDVAVSPLPPHKSYEVSSPAKIFEYLSMGLPVICSDITPHQKILSKDKTGFFFEPENPDDLAIQLRKVVELDEKEWENIRSLAREKALENRWSDKVDEVRQILLY